MLSETRYLARPYKPFARRYDKSCLYYNVTGNRRFQYMYDPSCEYNRDAYGRTQMVVQQGLGGLGAVPLSQHIIVLTEFADHLKNPKCHVFVSRGSSSGGGAFADGSFCWLVIFNESLQEVSAALGAAGISLDARAVNASLLSSLMVPATAVNAGNRSLTTDNLMQDTSSYLGTEGQLFAKVSSALSVLKARLPPAHPAASLPAPTQGLSKGVKIGIGVGVATGLTALVFALRQNRSSGVHGARRRR